MIAWPPLLAGVTLPQFRSERLLTSGEGGVALVLLLLIIVSWCVIFEKAGQAGWKGIIPIYNVLIACEVVGWPWIAALLFIVPVVSFFAWIAFLIALARSFGRGGLFVVGLWLLPFVFLPVLAFGSARYEGPGGR